MTDFRRHQHRPSLHVHSTAPSPKCDFGFHAACACSAEIVSVAKIAAQPRSGKTEHSCNHPKNPYHCPGEEFEAAAWRFGATASQMAGKTGAAEIELIAQGAKNFAGPILLLASACNDWIGEDAQRVHLSFFQRGKLMIVPNSGHDMIWDNPDETLPLIRAFLGE